LKPSWYPVSPQPKFINIVTTAKCIRPPPCRCEPGASRNSLIHNPQSNDKCSITGYTTYVMKRYKNLHTWHMAGPCHPL
jgi:hypothetical protein